MTIKLTEKFNAIARQRARERGCRDVRQYVNMLISEDAPAPISQQLEAELVASLVSAGEVATKSFWSARRNRLRKTLARKSRA